MILEGLIGLVLDLVRGVVGDREISWGNGTQSPYGVRWRFMTRLDINSDSPRVPDVARLLEAHRTFAVTWSQPGVGHALDVDQLAADDISLFSARHSGELVGTGALQHLDAAHVEIKSMHTAEEARGRGVGRAMLQHLLTTASDRGYRRVSLETGTGDAFAPARALYRSLGFETCSPFGSYQSHEDSICLSLRLE